MYDKCVLISPVKCVITGAVCVCVGGFSAKSSPNLKEYSVGCLIAHMYTLFISDLKSSQRVIATINQSIRNVT